MRRSASAVSLALLSLLALAPPAHGLQVVPPEIARETPPGIEILSSDEHGISLVFDLRELVKGNVSIAGENFQILSVPGGGFAGAVGAPAVPTYSRLLAIPEGLTVSVRAVPLEEQDLTGIRLLPVQAGDGSPFAYDREAYRAERMDDAPGARAGTPTTMRGLRLIPLTFQPVHYNPAAGTVRVVHRMRVDVSFEGGAARPPAARPIPASFDRMCRELVVNYEPAPDAGTVPGTCLIICPNDQAVVDSLTPLVTWRTRAGMPTTLVTTAETGSFAGQIKAYIQSVYDDPAISLEYVVLAGDATGTYKVPTWFETLSGHHGEGDLPYAQLTGGVLPDVHYGRLSFEDLATLGHIVQKIIQYESNPYVADPTWFTRSCVVGDGHQSGPSCIETGRWLVARLAEIGYTEADSIYIGPFVGKMQTALNRGDSVFGYRGFYGMSGWSNALTYTLANGWKMPFAVMITCDTGSFASGTSRTEAFLRAWDSTAGIPRAAIGAIGLATGGTETRFNNCLYFGIWQGLVVEGLHTMGAARTRGSVELWMNYGAGDPTAAQVFSHWMNLMGDPIVDVWTSFPRQLVVAHPAGLARGANSVTVTVSDGTNPVEGARVCLWNGAETYAVGTTDATGAVELPVSTPTEGSMLVTVTGHDLQPYLADIPVTDAELYVGYSSSLVVDDGTGESQGNGDGLVNPSETIELRVELENTGSSGAPGVTATLASADAYVTVVDSGASFGDIPAGESAWGADAFVFSVRPDCPHGHVIRLSLNVDSGGFHGHSLIDLAVVSGDLEAQGTTLYDDENGVLDPGETREMSVALRNEGGADADGVTGTLVSLSPRVGVLDDSGTFGPIVTGDTGENTVDRFRVSADPTVYDGYLANFALITQFSEGTTDTTHFGMTIGTRVSTDPVGPDAHGYLAYDHTDTSYPEAPVYRWIEIDPAYGGDGIEIVLGDLGAHMDKSALVNLPFPFSYYGETYSEATVCSNGWLAFGVTDLTSFYNWTIPGAGGPDALVAIFWDDLFQADESKVYQKFDPQNHYWILEWSRMRRGEATETFELILFDPIFYTTPTGDGMLEFQYQEVVNNDEDNAYATVGIESPDHMDGLLYSYYNLYPDGAAPLAAGLAIKFVPTAEDWSVTAVETGRGAGAAKPSGLDPCRPNPFGPETRITYRLAETGTVRLAIYDVSGRLITTLVDGERGAGEHLVRWDGCGAAGAAVSPGVYFMRLEAPGVSQVRPVTLLR